MKERVFSKSKSKSKSTHSLRRGNETDSHLHGNDDEPGVIVDCQLSTFDFRCELTM